MSNCKTVGGMQRTGTEWSGATHHACTTTTYGLPPWCATRTNNHGFITSNQISGFCDRRKCVFPFKKYNKWHNEYWKNSACIPECPKTVTDNGTPVDMAYCGPECPGSEVADQCVEASDGDGKGKITRRTTGARGYKFELFYSIF